MNPLLHPSRSSGRSYSTMMETLGYVVAAAPFLVAGATLLGFRWPPVYSGLAGLMVALAGALLWPGLHAAGLAGAMVEGLGTIGRVLYVLFGGLLLYNVLSEGGAIESVSQFLTRMEPDRGALALLGVLGVGTLIGANLAGFNFQQLSDASAWLSLPLFPVYGIATLGLSAGRTALRRRGFEAVYVGLAMGLGVLVSSLYLVPELAGAIGGLVAVGAFLLRRVERLRGMELPVRALAPYGFLLALLVGVNSAGTVRAALESFGPVFAGPGPWLLLSALFAVFFLGLDGKAAVSAARRTVEQWLPVAGAIVTFILAGQVVSASGAAELLAVGAAGALGAAYPAASPLVGALGGGRTGANAGSNALFMPF